VRTYDLITLARLSCLCEPPEFRYSLQGWVVLIIATTLGPCDPAPLKTRCPRELWELSNNLTCYQTQYYSRPRIHFYFSNQELRLNCAHIVTPSRELQNTCSAFSPISDKSITIVIMKTESKKVSDIR